MNDWKFGDILRPKIGNTYGYRILMYVGPTERNTEFIGTCIRPDPNDDFGLNRVSVGAQGVTYRGWFYNSFDKLNA